MNMVQIEKERAAALAQLKEANEVHAALQRGIRRRLLELLQAQQLLLAGLDLDKIEQAKRVIYVRGQWDTAGDERLEAMQRAINALIDGGERLREDYQGTKNYDRWRGQHIECAYGTAPTHGDVVFQIGLTVDRRHNPQPLSEAEIDAAIYYLRGLERIQDADHRAAVDASHLMEAHRIT